jgi:hypothetical protein
MAGTKRCVRLLVSVSDKRGVHTGTNTSVRNGGFLEGIGELFGVA